MYEENSRAAYQAASVDAETQVGLLLVAYEALAQYLSRAAAAVDQQDIPARCDASNRALTLLGHIESWITYLNDPDLGASLVTFYTWLRQQIVLCQLATSRAQFDVLAEVVLRLRTTWQEKKEKLVLEAASISQLAKREDTHAGSSSKLTTWYA